MVLSLLFGVGPAGYAEAGDSALTLRTSLAHRRFLLLHRLLRTQENA